MQTGVHSKGPPAAPHYVAGYRSMALPEEEALKRRRTCIICGTEYSNATNTGRHECRQHSLGIINNAFECCGQPADGAGTPQEFYTKRFRSKTARGCVIADHRETYAPFNTAVNRRGNPTSGSVEFPEQEAWVLNPLPSAMSVVEDHRGLVAVIQRYDVDAVEKMAVVMLNHQLAVDGILPPHLIVRAPLSHNPRLIDVYLKLAQTAVPRQGYAA